MRHAAKSVMIALPAAAVLAAAVPAAAQSTDAAARCLDVAGPPDAGVPVSRDALARDLEALQRARADCEEAAARPDPAPAALYHMGVILQREGAHDTALARFEAAAERGVAAAHTKLGDYYNFGIGPIEEDHDRAVAGYRAAAEAGDMPAKTTLAIMHGLGRGVAQDSERMIALLQDAADAGYHFAQVRLAQVYRNADGLADTQAEALGLPDPEKAATLYEMAAEQGNTTARTELAKLYADASLFDDPEKQAAWTRRAAEAGNPAAINTLGFLHERGKGVAYDPVRAAELYVEALETGEIKVSGLRGRDGGRTPKWDRQTALEFQKILKDRGFYRGALDAIVGPGTLGAARKLAGD
ncbi:tetratricopeptide repeat protein [Roseovarius salinarum]|uniref:tetratricopeptide repeat protein n=1 Tax=Roseovarius salinarum TaxID=1981892 RepID=UPI001E2F6CBE|nr:tetratricopeptide repeat protein [Roseovarius salinarum]